MKTTNQKCRKFINQLEEFKASNLSGTHLTNCMGSFYVVYSYGWFPLYVYSYDRHEWYKNSDRYNKTGQSYTDSQTTQVTHETLKDMLAGKVV